MESSFAAKARENVRAAAVLFDDAMYNASANRAYYGALHAAVAALSDAGIELPRIDHEKVQAQFSSELIRRKKVFPGRFRSFLTDLQVVRNVADYGSNDVSKKVAQRQLHRAREYVDTLLQERSDVQ